jgi:hypothetical protein
MLMMRTPWPNCPVDALENIERRMRIMPMCAILPGHFEAYVLLLCHDSGSRIRELGGSSPRASEEVNGRGPANLAPVAEEWMKLAQTRDQPIGGVMGALSRIYASR